MADSDRDTAATNGSSLPSVAAHASRGQPAAAPPDYGGESPTCAHCNSAVPAGAAFCPTCGRAQRELSGVPTPSDERRPVADAGTQINVGPQATVGPQANIDPHFDFGSQADGSPRSPWLAGATPREGVDEGKATVPAPPAGSTQATRTGASLPSGVGTAVPARPKPGLSAGEAILGTAFLIGDGIGMLWRGVIVIAVIVGGFLWVKSLVGGGLTEHSSCQDFQQASADAQNKVLQDMLAAHHSNDSIQLARFSVNLYCNVYGGSAPIDGIYGSGNVPSHVALAGWSARASDGTQSVPATEPSVIFIRSR